MEIKSKYNNSLMEVKNRVYIKDGYRFFTENFNVTKKYTEYPWLLCSCPNKHTWVYVKPFKEGYFKW